MIVYASRTGNVRYIVSKLMADAVEISEGLIVIQPYLLISYTDGLGDIPVRVKDFLENNAAFCQGVVVSGNSNFGHSLYGGAGEKIVAAYEIPLVRKIDLRGTQSDYEAIQAFYEMRVKGCNLIYS